MIGRLFCALFVMTSPLMAQGFAGLGTDADGFSVPAAGYNFDFPADHGPHPDYRIEWWYLTANLQDAKGTAYGVQWTLFRSALAPQIAEGWQDPQIWFAHAALTSEDTHLTAERIARGGIGQAGAQAEPFEAWIDDWYMAGPSFDALRLTARGGQFAYDLDLTAQGPLVFHGRDGYSVKSDQGQASYYYSQPFFDVTGTLTTLDGDVAVTGSAWLDREWSSQPLAEGQSGWDWFSLSFDSGDKLMGFLLRDRDGGAFSSATWIEPDGTTTAFENGAFAAQPVTRTEVAGREVPTTWTVQLPDKGVDVTVAALNPMAWMGVSIPYWEGPVTVSGSHSGVGYLEMTGYE